MSNKLAPVIKLTGTYLLATLGGPLAALTPGAVTQFLKSVIGEDSLKNIADLTENMIGEFGADYGREFLERIRQKPDQDLRRLYLAALRESLDHERDQLRKRFGNRVPLGEAERELPVEQEKAFARWLDEIDRILKEDYLLDRLFSGDAAISQLLNTYGKEESEELWWGYLDAKLTEWNESRPAPDELKTRLRSELPAIFESRFAATLADSKHEQAMRKFEVQFLSQILREISSTPEAVKKKLKPEFENLERKVDSLLLKTSPAIDDGKALLPIHHIPHQRNRHFTGREELLERIGRALTEEGAAALTQAITGLGGVGKTQLATEYAYRHKSEYKVIWWINSEKSPTLVSDYARLAEKLGLPEKDEQDQRITVEAVRRWLERNDGWLLIFDNAEEPHQVVDYIPQSRAGHTLITSRHQDWSEMASSLSVPVFSREKSIEFLVKRTGQEDGRAAGELASELGDLPLALAHAGAYISTVQGTTLAKYLEMFRARRQELMKRASSPIGYEGTVATTWEMSFEKVKEESEAGAELLSLIAFLGPNDIPREMVRAGAKRLPTALAEAVTDDLKLGDAVKALLHYSLIEADEETWDVHRLVQTVTRDRMSEEERKTWAGAAVQVVDDAFVFKQDDMQTWLICAKLLQHALAAAGYAEALEIGAESAAQLFNGAGMYLLGRARFDEAREAFERAMKIDEAVYGSEHPSVAGVANNLGLVLREQGDYQRAQACFERAMKIDEAAYGPEHPMVAVFVNNLGELLREQGDYEGARACFERAMKIDEAVYGLDHPSVARDVNNLGLVLREQGDYEGARACFERAMKIDEAAYGPEHPSVATMVNNLGLVLYAQDDYEGAQACFERALKIGESVYGPEHPSVATMVSNLGMVLYAQGDYQRAQACFERAMRIDESAYGLEHPSVATMVNNLGGVLQEQGDYEGARACFERAMKIDEAAYGPDHPSVATILNNLGNVLRELGDYEGARACFERAMKIDEAAYGPEHPSVALIVNSLGEVLREQGDYEGARACFERALKICEAAYGLEHPMVATFTNNLGNVLRELGDYEGARACFERALRICRRFYGDEHPHTKIVAESLRLLGPSP